MLHRTPAPTVAADFVQQLIGNASLNSPRRSGNDSTSAGSDCHDNVTCVGSCDQDVDVFTTHPSVFSQVPVNDSMTSAPGVAVYPAQPGVHMTMPPGVATFQTSTAASLCPMSYHHVNLSQPVVPLPHNMAFQGMFVPYDLMVDVLRIPAIHRAVTVYMGGLYLGMSVEEIAKVASHFSGSAVSVDCVRPFRQGPQSTFTGSAIVALGSMEAALVLLSHHRRVLCEERGAVVMCDSETMNTYHAKRKPGGSRPLVIEFERTKTTPVAMHSHVSTQSISGSGSHRQPAPARVSSTGSSNSSSSAKDFPVPMPSYCTSKTSSGSASSSRKGP